MKSGSGLIVLQTLEDGAIDDDFVVLSLSPDDAKRFVYRVMINVDLDSLATSGPG